MTMNPDPLEVWKAAMTQWCYGMPDALSPSFGDDQAAAAVIAQHYAPLLAEVERLREALRDMADAVAVYSQQPVEATRQRPRIHQDQWDQIAMICGDMLRQALAAKGDSRG